MVTLKVSRRFLGVVSSFTQMPLAQLLVTFQVSLPLHWFQTREHKKNISQVFTPEAHQGLQLQFRMTVLNEQTQGSLCLLKGDTIQESTQVCSGAQKYKF